MSTQKAATPQPLLQAIDLKKHYPVKKGLFAPERLVKALDGVSFTLERGKTLAVVGESGCGKSTLGRLLTMIEIPTGGELYYQGQDLLKHDPQAQKLRRQKIQIVFQNPYGSLNPRKKVGQILEEPLLINSSLSKEQRREKALAMMAKVGLKTEHYDRYPHMFSGGQRQRIAIARGLMLDPDVVIADEPVSALDVSVRAQVLNLMMDLQQDLGLSYVFISHDLSVVEHIADEKILISQPEYPWECATHPTINEGPAVLIHGSTVNLAYSASGSWTDNYCIGLLTAQCNADLADPTVWSKRDTPILRSGRGIYGPGHNSFVVSPDGFQVEMIYHSTRWHNGGFNRSVRFRPVSFDHRGRILPMDSIPPNQLIERPSGESHRLRYYYNHSTDLTIVPDSESVTGFAIYGLEHPQQNEIGRAHV